MPSCSSYIRLVSVLHSSAADYHFRSDFSAIDITSIGRRIQRRKPDHSPDSNLEGDKAWNIPKCDSIA
jgi:hypothetical protein